MNDVTRILQAMNDGDASAARDLLPAVYDELRQLAQKRLAQERASHTLQATALVHEAYLKIAGNDQAQFSGRTHFFAAAAEAMRRILIDAARRRKAARHGGNRQQLALDESILALAPRSTHPDELLSIDQALKKLSIQDPVKAQLVNLRFFAGLSIDTDST